MSLSIPAWKRLGLKLKYAKDQPEPSDASGAGRTSSREHQVAGDDDERPHKRQRMSNIDKGETNDSQNFDAARKSPSTNNPTSIHSSSQVSDQTSRAPVHKTPKRQKSVTFSTDTKASDGDSRITIDFPAGSPGSTPYKAKHLLDTAEPASPTTNGTAEDLPEAESGKPKKKKTSSAKKLSRQQLNGKGKTDSALPYLAQHRHDKDSWKFNKNRDVWIVSHALDTGAIPTSHVLALAGYVGGLPEKAAARKRLIQQCKDDVVKTEDQRPETKEEQAKFLALVKDTEGNADAQTDFLNGISRPVLLLWALGEDAGNVNKKSKTFTGEPLVERNRKSRTAVPIDLSSSESDSDTEDSDSDSDNDEQSGVAIANGVGVAAVSADDTSSSGTNSSSGSDSSSDSSSDGDSD